MPAPDLPAPTAPAPSAPAPTVAPVADVARGPLAQVAGLAPDAAAAYRPRAVHLADRIAEQVCSGVAGYAHPALRPVVADAVVLAVGLFVDAVAGVPVRGTAVAEHFERLGRTEAEAGRDLDAMGAAHQVATQAVWEELHRVGAGSGLGAAVVDRLADGLLRYQGWLHGHAARGFAAASRGARGERSWSGTGGRAGSDGGVGAGTPPRPTGPDADPRRALFAALVGGASPERRAGLVPAWPVPTSVGVVTTATAGARPSALRALVGLPETLGGLLRDHLVLLVDECRSTDVAAEVARLTSGPVALGWGVAPEDVPHAVRWTMRALRLVRQGLIPVPAGRVVRCRDHRSELWLHADATLGHAVAHDLLAPLLEQKPQQREVLGETLLLWLQTRASAPALADALGVHHQTVRNRLRRLRELLGDVVDEPARSAELLQALEVLRGGSAGR